MVIWTLDKVHLISWRRCVLLLLSPVGAKPVACLQPAAKLHPFSTEAAFGEHMANPNSCRPPLIKIWTVFNYTTRFKLYRTAFSLSLIQKKHLSMQSSAPKDLLSFKSAAWKAYLFEHHWQQISDEQTEPHHHASCYYKVHPLSPMFWD